MAAMKLELRWLFPLLQVFDMPASLRFYRDVLGFAEVQKSGDDDDVDWAWLREGQVELMLNTAYEREERPPSPDPARIAAHRDTLIYLGCESVDVIYERLQAHGVNVGPPKVAPYRMNELNVLDPDGYELCFQSRVESQSVVR